MARVLYFLKKRACVNVRSDDGHKNDMKGCFIMYTVIVLLV
jgi:hypothetical protein